MTAPTARSIAPGCHRGPAVNRPGRPVRLGWVVMVFALLASGCAEQMLQRQAREQATAGQWPQALVTLQEGLRRYPESVPLRSSLLQTREQALATHLAAAAAARDAGRLDVARQELEAAGALEPRNARVAALLDALTIQQSQRPIADDKAASKQTGVQAGVQAAARIETRPTALPSSVGQPLFQSGTTATRLTEQRPITLDFRDAPLRTVLDLVSRHSGIDFILDREIRADLRVTLLMRQARVEDALELLVGSHQLVQKVVDAHTVLIYPNTPDKLREYQEQVVRVFHLASADAKAAAAFLRAMLKIRDPFVDERSNLLAMRDTPDNIVLAERLLALFDAGEPEVLLEVEVLEISSSRLTELGIKFPDTLSLTPLPPLGESALTLANASGIDRSRLGLGVAGLLLNLKRQVGDFSTLANPRIHARNREKAKIMIGDKIPIVTTTTGTGGFVSESVSYLDVGLKLEVEPTVYADDEVGIRIALEVSSLGSAVKTASGSLAYQIGTRNASTLLRLRDGETQLLAGLISKDERSSASRVPGLGDVPVLGRLFSNQLDQGTRTELMLAITPRILRNIAKPDARQSELWVGTDALPRLRQPRVPLEGVQAAAPVTTLATTLATTAMAPALATTGASAAAPAGATTTATATATATAAADIALPLTITWAGPNQAKVGEVMALQLQLGQGLAMRGLPFEIAYDAKHLQWIDAAEGDVFNRDGVATLYQANLDATPGRLRVALMRRGATSAAGPGRLITLRFKAIAAGSTALQLENAQPIVLSGAAPPASRLAWPVEILASPK